MPQISFVNLLIVAAVAVLAPLLLGYLPRLRLPAVVVEIVAGVVLGPSVLGWVQIDLPVQILAILGWLSCCFWPGWRSTAYAARSRLTPRRSGLWDHTRAWRSDRRDLGPWAGPCRRS